MATRLVAASLHHLKTGSRAILITLRILATVLFAGLAGVSLMSWWLNDYITWPPPSGAWFPALCLFILALNFGFVRAKYRQLQTWYLQSEASKECATVLYRDIVVRLVSRLRLRARQKRIESIAALMTILLSMFIAALAFTRSGFDFSEALVDLETYQDDVRTYSQNVLRQDHELTRARSKLGNASSPEERAELQREVESLEPFLDSDRESLEEARVELNRQSARAEAVTRGQLYASIAARLGIAVVLIFLVQILVGLYRYCSRLEALYQAQADALLLVVFSGKETLRELVRTLAPNGIDFGQAPASPLDQTLNTIQSLKKGA